MDVDVRTAETDDGAVTVDASGLGHACPLDLVGIVALLAGARRDGHEAHLVLPSSANVAAYLSRMDVVAVLDGQGVHIDGVVPSGPRRDLSTSLIEVTSLPDAAQVEEWNPRLVQLVSHNSDRHHANLFFKVVGEVLGNAVEHGRSEIGAFVSAQFYSGQSSGGPPRIEVAVADGGPGILDHLSTVHDVDTAEAAIRLALQGGVSGLPVEVVSPGDAVLPGEVRGHGLDEVDLVGRQLGGQILIRSTDGLGLIEFSKGVPRPSYQLAPQSFPGTWVLINLHLPQG